MTTLKLISHKLCPYVQRARIVLNEKSVPHTIEFIDLANKPSWFLAISPLGKVPVLLVDDTPLFESNAIAEYLDETTPGSLHPQDPIRRARNRGWLEFASSTLSLVAGFYNAPDAQSLDHQRVLLHSRFQVLDSELGEGPWFNGSEFSLVDAAFAPLFRYFEVFDRIADFGILKGCARVKQWRDSLADRPSVRKAVVDDYAELLHQFLANRRSELSRYLSQTRAHSA